jgi:hypothetical protein
MTGAIAAGRRRDLLDDACVRGHALRAAERGWHVFPTRPGGKEPREGLSWPTAACADMTRLSAATWRPGENYGIAAKPSGLVILDLDVPKDGHQFPPEWQAEPCVRDGKDVLASLAELAGQEWPTTYMVQTPSGGWHLYYTAAAGRAIGNRPLGGPGALVDVRGGGSSNGGYVLGAGSFLGGRPYVVVHDQDPEELPGWIADLLDPPAGACPTGLRSAGSIVPNRGDACSRMRGVLDRLAGAQPGQGRNAVLHWAACRFGEMITAGEIDAPTAESALYMAAEANGHVAKHGERRTRATIASGMRRVVAA